MSDIHKAISERILVLDGAMGTMLQRYNFSEEDFRGERFKENYPNCRKTRFENRRIMLQNFHKTVAKPKHIALLCNVHTLIDSYHERPRD